MRLTALLGPEITAPPGLGDIEVTGITADSRKVKQGFLFAALPGAKADGAKFIAEALAKGAVAVLAGALAEVPHSDGVPLLRAPEPRLALAKVAARYYAAQPRCAVAVTGTSGKTSVAEFTRQIFQRLGHQAASLGTLGLTRTDGAAYGSLTTPDPITLHATLAELAADGITHIAFEASSHGLDQHRLDGVKLSAAAFTNLGRDHLDYHPTMEAYLAAKLRLFSELLQPGQPAVVSADDTHAEDVIATARTRGLQVLTVGERGEALRLDSLAPEGFAQRMRVAAAGRAHDLRLPLLGAYQASNALVAAGLALAVGESLDGVMMALERLEGVKGRLEIVSAAKGGLVVVDYAHKPDALAAALDALRPFATGRLICVFGCGGDRDRGKRPIMGRIAVERADVTIVTDDNPRSERPEAIRAEILTGAKGAREIGDRAEAIAAAIAMLGPGDVVLIAGKGHETGQIIGDRVLPFSDQEAAKAALETVGAMMQPLWTAEELIAACGGEADGVAGRQISGFSINSRSLGPGDVFVALKDRRDGHDFVQAAFERGAAAALVARSYVRQPADGLLIRVEDTLEALQSIGRASRARLSSFARVIAVTGSVGKTGTKEMLKGCLSAVAPTHAADKSFNNHWGVPLTLARMPKDARFAIFEIGMNHAGEIAPLTRMVRPHVAIVTTVEPVHLGHFASVEEIADAKAEIFLGLEPGGVAVINRDNEHFDRLRRRTVAAGGRVLTFGSHAEADVRPDTLSSGWTGSDVSVTFAGRKWAYHLSASGLHLVMNSLAVVSALAEVLPAATTDESTIEAALRALEGLLPSQGRGSRFMLELPAGEALLIDESYNANPASMRAALAALASVPRERFRRRIAVLGDMLELGQHAEILHKGLKEAVDAAGADLVFACGPHMRGLFDALPEAQQARWADSSEGLAAPLLETVAAGDVVMVKGSLGSRMAPLVAALKARAVAVPV